MAKRGQAAFSCGFSDPGDTTPATSYNAVHSRNVVVFTPLSKITKGKVKSILMPAPAGHGAPHFR
ncbi:MAG: hypothetical protein QM747_10270 [Nocardioides sp.]